MRPIWNGYITFGLVNIPVEVYRAERNVELNFHMLDSRDKGRIHYQRINEKTGKVVPWNKIVKAFEYKKDKYIVIKKGEFTKISQSGTVLDIQNFVSQDEVETEYFVKPYFLVPKKEGIKSYFLLCDSLLKEEKYGIAKVILHEREHLVAIVPRKNYLVLEVLRFEKELEDISQLKHLKQNSKDIKFTANELSTARQLINSMTTHWTPEKYHDQYKEALFNWIDKKTHGKVKESAKVIKFKPSKETKDLVKLMKKSIESLHGNKKATAIVHSMKNKTKRR